MIQQEADLNKSIESWRSAEQEAQQWSKTADSLKQAMIAKMHELGLKSQDSDLGRVSLSPTKKCNLIVERAEFERKLKDRGMYERFCETKLSLDRVKKYVESEGDDLYGMVEVETNYMARFTPRKDGTHGTDTTPASVE